MATSKPVNATPWSYSSLSSFETCPRRHYLVKVAKVVTEPMSDAITFGNKVHKELELATKGEKGLSIGFQNYQPIVDRLRAAPGKKLIEYKFGLTKAFKPTSFFGSDVWVRGVFDYGSVNEKSAAVLDFKTGSPKINIDQLRLFAGAALQLFPQLEQVKTGYLWLAFNKVDTETFKRGDESEIWADFSSRVYRMERAFDTGDFPPKPSGLCKAWCPVGKKNCEFCGKE